MRRRSGFTLVEVLVAMALILFIMTILATAFGAATQTVSDLKSAGDLAEKLRGASTILRRDLEADHCFNKGGTVLHVSSVFGVGTDPDSQPDWGFFRIYEGQQEVQEGADSDGIQSFRQTTNALHYTIALGSQSGLSGIRRNDYLSALVPSNSPLLSDPALAASYPPDQRYQDSTDPNAQTFNSPAAEVAVFLAPTTDSTDSSNGQTAQQLYALYRRQCVIVPPTLKAPQPTTQPEYQPPQPIPVPALNSYPSYIECSAMTDNGPNVTFNGIQDITLPVHRLGMQRTNPAGLYSGAAGRYSTMAEENSNPNYKAADLLLTDVLSFDVRVLIAGDSDFRELFDPALQPYSGNNPAFSGNGTPRVFDTWSKGKDASAGVDYTNWDGPWQKPPQPASASTIPLYKTAGPNGTTLSIKAIQIQLRVWDFKTKKTRQVTIVQQM